jgi:hypothetical protein
VHFSAKEFLLCDGKEWNLEGEVCDFFVNSMAANKCLLNCCISYLSRKGVQAELVLYGSTPVFTGDRFRGCFPLLDYSAENWVRHLGLVDRLEVDELEHLHAFLDSPHSFAWLQIYLTINEDQLYQLFWHCQALAG